MKRDFIDSGSLLEKEVLSKGRDALINANVNLGVWDKKAAFDLKKSLAKDWQDTDIRSAIATDATIAKDMLLNGDFKDLSADETAKWVETADKKIKRSEKIALEKRDQKWLENSGTLIENLDTTSVEDIIQLVAKGDINPKEGEGLINWKRDPETVQYETDKEIWMELARDSVNPEQDLRDLQQAISLGIIEGNLTSKDGANLSVGVKELFKTAVKYKSPDNPIKRAFRTAIAYINEWAKNTSPVDILPKSIDNTTTRAYDLIKDLLDLTKGAKGTPENIETTARQLVKDKIKEENPNKTKYVADQTYTFQSGTYKCIGQNEKGKPIFEEA